MLDISTSLLYQIGTLSRLYPFIFSSNDTSISTVAICHILVGFDVYLRVVRVSIMDRLFANRIYGKGANKEVQMRGSGTAITLAASLEHSMDSLLSPPRIPMKSNFSLHSLQRFSTLSRRRDAILHDGTAVSLENITGRLTESVVQPINSVPCFQPRQIHKLPVYIQ